MTQKRIKVLVLSDHPFSPSGVGTQTKYMIQALLESDKFDFICLGGAVKHQDYTPSKVEPWDDRFVIIPVDGYGSPDMIRSIMMNHKPDILWFMTDPRFYGWLWEMEDEIRQHIPMVYYHVWDNYPYPQFNEKFYESNDLVVTISKLTSDIVRTVCPKVEEHYLPHSVDTNIFRKLPDDLVKPFRDSLFEQAKNYNPDSTVFFWNNRNARRKLSGSVLWWFSEFLKEVGNDKAALIMHTDPKDVHGQDLVAIMHRLGLTNGEVLLSTNKYPPEQLSMIYNAVDCTINVSDAEGFGLATFESLSCETPIIVNMTGGLQEQVTDGKNWFGVGLEPTSKAIVGSQDVPYIYEDRVSGEDVIAAMREIHNMGAESRAALGKLGREHVDNNYSYDQYCRRWVKIMLDVHDRCGSWENRKNYNRWELIEL
jgi:glycosyltransferase involved in cell wall biosynthesis